MKLNLKTGVIFTAMGLAAYAAYAENVAISTYYPSPYGSYQTLDTTGTTNLATASGNVVMAMGGGNVGIGTAAPGSKLDVVGTARVGNRIESRSGPLEVSGSGWGVDVLLDTDGNSADLFSIMDGGVMKFTLEGNSGNVGIGVAVPAAKLDVNGRIRLTDGTNAGLLQVDCTTTPGSCYAVYA